MHIDVIIPVYNQAKQLDLVLKGFIKQNTKYNYDVLIVDDGSIENISEVVEKYGFKYFRQDNKGRAAARNFGVSKGNGKVIIFNDADRIPDEFFVEEHANSHIISSRKIVIGTPRELYIRNINENESGIWRSVEKNDNRSRMTNFTSNILKIYDDFGYTNSSLAWISTFSGNMSVQREEFAKHWFDENFMDWGLENIDLGFRLFNSGCLFFWNSKCINFHLAHPREKGFYESKLYKSGTYLKEKYTDGIVHQVVPFLLGEISLQEFEMENGNRNARWMKNSEKEVINKIIK